MKINALNWAGLALLSAAMLGFTSCSTLNSGGSRTLKQTEMDVSWPMTRFRNAVAAGAVTRGEQEAVNSAYASYEAAYREALQTTNNNRNAPAPDNVKALATKVIGAIESIPF